VPRNLGLRDAIPSGLNRCAAEVVGNAEAPQRRFLFRADRPWQTAARLQNYPQLSRLAESNPNGISPQSPELARGTSAYSGVMAKESLATLKGLRLFAKRAVREPIAAASISIPHLIATALRL